jgi:hypothetical protein
MGISMPAQLLFGCMTFVSDFPINPENGSAAVTLILRRRDYPHNSQDHSLFLRSKLSHFTSKWESNHSPQLETASPAPSSPLVMIGPARPLHNMPALMLCFHLLKRMRQHETAEMMQRMSAACCNHRIQEQKTRISGCGVFWHGSCQPRNCRTIGGHQSFNNNKMLEL